MISYRIKINYDDYNKFFSAKVEHYRNWEKKYLSKNHSNLLIAIVRNEK